MIDFTLHIYRQLLATLLQNGYQFVTFEQYLTTQSPLSNSPSPIAHNPSPIAHNPSPLSNSPSPIAHNPSPIAHNPSPIANRPSPIAHSPKFILLRHDVDLLAANSLATARIEHELSIQATYYFRVVPQSNQPDIIRSIAALGHEVGYHYEDMALCQGDHVKAFAHFQEQLTYFRQFYPVRTICMHGAPTSAWDGKELWKHYDYRSLGILGEPYMDVDFSQIFYLTDTGRSWDGYKVSVRDKIPVYQDQWNAQGLVYHRTQDIIRAVEQGSLPARVMITTHPQRWTDRPLAWLKELLVQNAKNIIKRLFLVKK